MYSTPAEVGRQVDLALALGRLRGMVGELLMEQRRGPLDEPARDRLRSIYLRSIDEARLHLPAGESAELARLSRAFVGAVAPSDTELRLANGQLVGWIEGHLNGVQLNAAITEASTWDDPRVLLGGAMASGATLSRAELSGGYPVLDA